jgi:hypothetical protein
LQFSENIVVNIFTLSKFTYMRNYGTSTLASEKQSFQILCVNSGYLNFGTFPISMDKGSTFQYENNI